MIPRSAPSPPRGAGLIAYHKGEGLDAIDEYSRRLVAALADRGDRATYSLSGLPPARTIDDDCSWVILQYNPFSYGRGGFAPQLLLEMARIRRRLAVPVGVMVHECWVETHDWRSGLMGVYQQAQLRALSRMATVLMTSTQTIARQIGRGAVHVPVASNITPVDSSHQLARESLWVGDRLVVTLFGRGNPSRALSRAEEAIDAIASCRGPGSVLVFNLGAEAPVLRLDPAIQVVRPGVLGASQLSYFLWASDLMLLPFTDGLSTRRTTLMAALAHGVPVLSQQGPATDDVLVERDDVFTLTPIQEPDAFARRAAELVADPDGLSGKGRIGRHLYLESFDWPHVARRVMSAMDDVSTGEAVGSGPRESEPS